MRASSGMLRVQDEQLIEVASAWTPQGAAGIVELLRCRGIVAQVRMSDPLLGGGSGFWPVVVRESDASAAREVLVSDEAVSTGRIDLLRCPGCQYSLDGLASAARCPECGLELEEVKCRLGGVLIRVTEEAPATTEISSGIPARSMFGVVVGGFIVVAIWLTPTYYLTAPAVILPAAAIAVLVLTTLWRVLNGGAKVR